MGVATALTEPNPLTAEECTNRIFGRLDKDNNGEEMISPLSALNHGAVVFHPETMDFTLVHCKALIAPQ